jgi:hypothetical protein
MVRQQFSRFGWLCMLMVYLSSFPAPHAAAKSTVLKVGQSGAYLYLDSDPESERIGTLRPGTRLIQIIQTIEQSTWYMVKTESGQVGWVNAHDVEPVRSPAPPVHADEAVIQFGPGSTWRANIGNSGSLAGTWTGMIDRSTGAAMGSWTLRDGANRIVLGGSWSAVKSSGKWRGSWRALVKGQRREHSGTWISEVPLNPTLSFASFFERAMSQAITGTWQSAGRSGHWSIRAAR